ncbi:hypothetical protein T492DRAFT_887677 [Pavlovales sp. CCMP2436]|nr:hypothetical protein T492DRAFT_887677 [Pavlovales sp. CCMP2436]
MTVQNDLVEVEHLRAQAPAWIEAQRPAVRRTDLLAIDDLSKYIADSQIQYRSSFLANAQIPINSKQAVSIDQKRAADVADATAKRKAVVAASRKQEREAAGALKLISDSLAGVAGMCTNMLVAHAWLASSFANGDLPPWFYFVFLRCASARPIGISCALRRGLTKGVFLNKGLRGEIEEYLFPQQLGVLVSAGGTKLIFSAREVLENPSFCIAGSDIYNAFNEGDRAEMIARTLASSPSLAPLARLFNATLAPKYQIFAEGGTGSHG